jgi:cyclohexadienyl dehydratase
VAGGDLAPAPLRVGTSGDYAPFSTEVDDAPDGFDVAVARAYAKDRGRDLEIVDFRWPELEQRLLAGDFDVAMSGITVRGDRLARAPMTAAVAYADAVLVVRGERPVRSVPPEGDGLVVGVNRGGHLERLARARLPKARLVPVDDNRRLGALLRGGEVDAVVSDSVEVAVLGTDDDGAHDKTPLAIAAVLERDRKAYWITPGEPALADDLDAWLREQEASGALEALRSRYGIAPWPRDSGAIDWTGATNGGAKERRIAELELSPAAARVADLLARRLMLMPAVAEAKRAAKLAIADPAREAAVESKARASAIDFGLAPAPYGALVRAEIEAAKRVQQVVLANQPVRGPSPSSAGALTPAPSPASGDRPIAPSPPPDLQRELRPAIDRIDAALRDELVRSAPIEARISTLAAMIRAWAQVPGLDEAGARTVAEAALAIPAVGRTSIQPNRFARP